jgi:hypothetical protein
MKSSASLPQTRGYQQEMLEESLQKNIIVALDTGSGKTHIAVLRMKFECERETKKVCVRLQRWLTVLNFLFTLGLLVPCANRSAL